MGEIKKDQKVKLLLAMADGSQKEVDCQTKEVYSDRISLTTPTDVLENAEYLDEGEEFVVKIFTPTGVKIFDTIVLDSPHEEEFIIEYAEIASEVQRREYVRVPIQVKIVVQREGNSKGVIASTLDVSGGGLRFTYDNELTPGEEVLVTLYFPEMKIIQVKGIVIHNDFLPENVYVLAFTEINEMDRDRIIKKCFEEQAKKLDANTIQN